MKRNSLMKRDTLIIAAVLAAISIVILGGSVACTWAIAHGASMKWRILFRLFCHGIPRRCLTIWGVPMPICARCTAIYIGALTGIVGAWLLPWMSERAARFVMYAAATPLAIDGLTQLTTLRESTNMLRLMTGAIGGIGFALWALTAVQRHVSAAPESLRSSS
jgi:uncharacterized membrane protein